MKMLETYKKEYDSLSTPAKIFHNSLYGITFAVSLYPSGIYESYYRNYVVSRVIQTITLPDEISHEGVVGITLSTINTVIPQTGMKLNRNFPLEEVCEDVLCQIGVIFCSSSQDNFVACMHTMAY